MENQVKETAAKVLNVFGYINMQPEYLTVIEYTEAAGGFNYILATDGKLTYQLNLTIEENSMRWELKTK